MKLPQATIIPLHQLEDAELLAVKQSRTKVEYCWTAASSTILYVLEKYGVDKCTYLDADLFFYKSPSILLEEIGDRSILMTEHRYSAPYAHLAKRSGIYCIQFITFKNDERGLRVLRWWRSACLDWCYDREEDGKFGDQKYLDDWTTRFSGVHVLENLGGGVAPWNIQQYELKKHVDMIECRKRATGELFPIIFYHFHYLRFYSNGTIDLGDYRISDGDIDILYKPYIHTLESIKCKIKTVDSSFDPHGPREIGLDWGSRLIRLKRKLRRQYNVFSADMFSERT
jgi:hypothetical protein